MIIRRGEIKDVKVIMNIIKTAITDMELKGIDQWDNIYPNEELIVNDINEENLYVCDDGINIQGIIVLNEEQDRQYESLKWEYTGRNVVIHRLCVDPKHQGKGIAKTLIQYAEKYGKENNYESIRLDAFIKNEGACKLYEKSGYNKVGIVNFRKGEFYCFEKGVG